MFYIYKKIKYILFYPKIYINILAILFSFPLFILLQYMYNKSASELYIFDSSLLAVSEEDFTMEYAHMARNAEMDQFPWQNMRSNEDFSAHLLAVANSHENIEEMSHWLENKGFQVFDTISVSSGRSYLNAHWVPAIIGENIQFTKNLSWLEQFVANGKTYRVQVVYEGGEPVRANALHIII